MVFVWPLALLIITNPLITARDTCTRQKYAAVKTDDHYGKLLDIDTGYSHDQLRKSFAERQSPTWKVGTAIDDVYGKLLCSYVFNCIHYMNIIKPLLAVEGRDPFKNPNTVHVDGDILFVRQMHGMLNVLYNFGKIGSVDPLWLAYMHISTLRNFNPLPETRELIERKTMRLLQEHETVSTRLAQFTQLQCNNDNDNNAYDDRNVDSIYFTSLAEIRSEHTITRKFIKTFLDKFKITIDERINIITKSMRIDDCTDYMKIRHLFLRPAVSGSVWQLNVLNDFLETIAGVDIVEKHRIFNIIDRTCGSNDEIESFEAQTNGIVECHRTFMNIMKYAMLHNLWIYVLEIAARLPSKDSDKTPLFEVFKNWFFDEKWMTEDSAIKRIKDYNSLIFDDFNKIVRLLNLKEDGQLKFIAELFQSSSTAHTLSDLEKIKEVEEKILATLKDVNNLKFNFPESYFSPAKFTNEYYKKRFRVLARKFSSYDYSMSTKIVSQLSFFLFGKYVEIDLSGIDFDVIASFDRFSGK